MSPEPQPISERNQKIVSRYIGGHSLREVAREFGISMQRVHQILNRVAPNCMRQPHVVPKRRRAA